MATELELRKAKPQRARTRSFDAAVRADDAMRGNEEVDLRERHRGGDAAMRERLTDRTRDVGIRDELAEAKRRYGSPSRDLQGRSLERKRQVESKQAPAKVGLYLLPGFGEQCVARFGEENAARGHEIARKYRLSVAYNQQIAPQRRWDAAAHRCGEGPHAKSSEPYAGTTVWAVTLMVGRSSCIAHSFKLYRY